MLKSLQLRPIEVAQLELHSLPQTSGQARRELHLQFVYKGRKLTRTGQQQFNRLHWCGCDGLQHQANRLQLFGVFAELRNDVEAVKVDPGVFSLLLIFSLIHHLIGGVPYDRIGVTHERQRIIGGHSSTRQFLDPGQNFLDLWLNQYMGDRSVSIRNSIGGLHLVEAIEMLRPLFGLIFKGWV